MARRLPRLWRRSELHFNEICVAALDSNICFQLHHSSYLPSAFSVMIVIPSEMIRHKKSSAEVVNR